MSLWVLAEVKRANDAAQDAELDDNAERGRRTPECPAHPLDSWGGQLDTTAGAPGNRSRPW